MGDGKSGGVVPPLVQGFPDGGGVGGGDGFAEKSGAEGAAGEAGAIDAEVTFASPDVASGFK